MDRQTRRHPWIVVVFCVVVGAVLIGIVVNSLRTNKITAVAGDPSTASSRLPALPSPPQTHSVATGAHRSPHHLDPPRPTSTTVPVKQVPMKHMTSVGSATTTITSASTTTTSTTIAARPTMTTLRSPAPTPTATSSATPATTQTGATASGRLAPPFTSGSVPFSTAAGAVSADVTWSGSDVLTLRLSCGRVTATQRGTSGLFVSLRVAASRCSIVLSEAVPTSTVQSYTVFITRDVVSREE